MLRDRIEQARRDRRLVEERQLDRDVRQLVELGLARVGRARDRLGDALAVDPAEDHEVQAVQAVGREGQQHSEIDGAEGEAQHGPTSELTSRPGRIVTEL